jgi:hypothetical protein
MSTNIGQAVTTLAIFANGRYTVVHKLGFETFSTVWLVRDGTTDKYL